MLYNFPLDLQKPEPIRQEFSLADLMHGIPDHDNPMVRDGHCYVTGIKFVKRGTIEYDDIVQRTLKHYESFLKPKEIQKIREELEKQDVVHVSTDFHAMRYPYADGSPYEAFITDTNVLAAIYFDTKNITLLPFGDPKSGPHRLILYDAVGSKLAGSRWQYDGTLTDALKEFSERGYPFNVGRHRRSASEWLELDKANPPPHKNYLTVKNGLDLEEALETVRSL